MATVSRISHSIGTPGTPWGAADKAAWLSHQRVQRSYAAEVLAPLQTRLPAQAELFQYGVLDYTRFGLGSYPLYAVRSRRWEPSHPVVVVTGGVHGYERFETLSHITAARKEFRRHGDSGLRFARPLAKCR